MDGGAPHEATVKMGREALPTAAEGRRERDGDELRFRVVADIDMWSQRDDYSGCGAGAPTRSYRSLSLSCQSLPCRLRA